MVMLLGGFALFAELLACPALLLSTSRREAPADLSGFTGLDADLSTLKPILKGAGADELVVDRGTNVDPAEVDSDCVAALVMSEVFGLSDD